MGHGRPGRVLAAAAAGALACLLSLASAASAANFVVDSLADTATAGGCVNSSPPECTLREAITEANGNGFNVVDTISFSASGTINVLSALPTISAPVTLTGFNTELNGAGAGAGTDGLRLSAGGSTSFNKSTISGIAINRFGGDGIEVNDADSLTIRQARIGTDLAGTSTAGLGNGGNGINLINSANGTAVGADFSGDVTVVSNALDGVHADATSANTRIQATDIGFSSFGFVNLPNGGDGIDLSSPSNTVGEPGLGNVIVANGQNGIRITGASANANQIVANSIGVDAFGEPRGNGSDGIVINDADNTIVGGTPAGEANTISGNGSDGVQISNGATNNRLLGNRIGTNAAGTRLRANQSNGVNVNSSPANVIGGAALGAGNVISGNDGGGIDLENTGSSNNVVQGNRIGTNAAGTLALPNGSDGIAVEGANVIGGSSAGEGNLVSGNLDDGISLGNNQPSQVQGNFIGTNAAGTSAIPNGGAGVNDSKPGTTVGGPGGAANTIAFNLGPGYRGSDTGGVVAENAIFSNGGLGIDLDPAGVTANDPGDADDGPHGLQNFPELAAAVALVGQTVVRGTFAGKPGQNLTLRFFSNPSCDESGNGEGQTPLGSAEVTTNGAGNASFEATLPAATAPGQQVTATATGPEGTSEFSACRAVEAAGALTLAPPQVSVTEGGRARLTITRAGATGIGATVRVATADGSARAGSDYTATSTTLAFAPGEASRTIEVPVTDDRVAERDESLTVTLSAPSGAALGQPASSTVTITGNDREPDSNITRPNSRTVRRIAGTASDPDGDLARVEVAIFSARAGARAARGRCLSIGANGRTRSTRPDGRSRCRARTFLRATGRARWSLRLPRALPSGTWVIVSRAVDRTGRRERVFSARDRNRAIVSVR